MTVCRHHLPGNVECPYPPIYVVLSPGDSGKTVQRVVCAVHLTEAINSDLRHIAGVRVRMLQWGHASEEALCKWWRGE